MADVRLRVAGSSIESHSVAPDNLNPLRNDAVEAAISRVLDAEVAARAAVAGARARSDGNRRARARNRAPRSHCTPIAAFTGFAPHSPR